VIVDLFAVVSRFCGRGRTPTHESAALATLPETGLEYVEWSVPVDGFDAVAIDHETIVVIGRTVVTAFAVLDGSMLWQLTEAPNAKVGVMIELDRDHCRDERSSSRARHGGRNAAPPPARRSRPRTVAFPVGTREVLERRGAS
jgi:hypothetical protein